MSDTIKNNPVIRISLTAAVGDKAQISFETYADAAAPKEFLDAMLDKLVAVKDRQVAFAELAGLDNLIITEGNQLKALEGDLLREDARQQALAKNAKETRVPYKAKQADVTARENIVANIGHRKNRMEDLKAELKRRQELVGKRIS